MNDLAILTTRKRAVIALVHSVIFFGVALEGFFSPKNGILRGFAPTFDYLLAMIYMTVAAVLAWLVGNSKCARERIYFALCTASAAFGLMRTLFGDANVPAAQPLRPIMLMLAIIVCTGIMRSFPVVATESVVSE
jgi:Sec-independent protein secretion pathway component TatC